MCNHIYLWSWSNMEWICKWFIRYYSQQQWHTDQFRWYYQRLRVFLFKDVRKHSSMLRIKAKFSLAFIHALILLLCSFLLFSKTFSSMRKETAAFSTHSSKTWKHKWCELSMFLLKVLHSLVILSFLFVFLIFMNSWKTIV